MSNVAVLISLARHPKSGRLMLSPNDARALAIAKQLSEDVRLVHVGRARDQLILRQYLGLGFSALDLLESPDDADVCEVLADYFTKHPARLLLAGLYGLGQDDTGLVPYVVADALAWPLFDRVLSVDPETQTLQQFLPRGQRRQLSLPEQAVMTISDKAPLTLEYVARRARQGQIRVHPGETQSVTSVLSAQWVREPRQPGRRRLTIKSNADGWNRFTKRLASPGGGGEVVKNDPEASIDRVLQVLAEKKLLPNAS